MKESRYNIWVERDGDDLRLQRRERLAAARAARRAGGRRTGAGRRPGDRDCPAELLEQMAVGRMLVADDADEIDLLAKRYELTRYDTSHFGLTIVTSLGCNFDCPYCFEAKHPSIMDDDVESTRCSTLLDDAAPDASTSFHVTWFGGEPLVGKRPLLALSDEFIARCDAAGVDYSAAIITNGYLLDEETCARAARPAGEQRPGVPRRAARDPRPHATARRTGGATFWRIVENLHHAVDYLAVSVRDERRHRRTSPQAEELLQILDAEGLSRQARRLPGPDRRRRRRRRGAVDRATRPACFTNPEFAERRARVHRLAAKYGFGEPSLPRPSGAPCTAVRKNELVVGSDGELYKCWDSVGNKLEVIGHIFDYANPNGRLRRWLDYDPFTNDECRQLRRAARCAWAAARTTAWT